MNTKRSLYERVTQNGEFHFVIVDPLYERKKTCVSAAEARRFSKQYSSKLLFINREDRDE